MEAKEVLKVVLREMTAYGEGWRGNWADFDGRRLQNQLRALKTWAEAAILSSGTTTYTMGTEFMQNR